MLNEVKRPMLVPKELLRVETTQVVEISPPILETIPISAETQRQQYKTSLSTIVNLFVFLCLLGLSIWLYTVYKNKEVNLSIIPLEELNNQFKKPYFIDPSIPENGYIIPYNDLQQDNSLDFMNII